VIRYVDNGAARGRLRHANAPRVRELCDSASSVSEPAAVTPREGRDSTESRDGTDAVVSRVSHVDRAGTRHGDAEGTAKLRIRADAICIPGNGAARNSGHNTSGCDNANSVVIRIGHVDEAAVR
jgi:hypothetical protein